MHDQPQAAGQPQQAANQGVVRAAYRDAMEAVCLGRQLTYSARTEEAALGITKILCVAEEAACACYKLRFLSQRQQDRSIH